MQVIQTEFNQGPNVRPQDIPFRTLARHLQLRLRYARLKVEHGWQKQSINEVENLYFHQQHFRNKTAAAESRPAPAAAPVNVAQTEAQASSSRAQDLSSSISVFNSRQTPNEILVLRPPEIPKDQECRSSDDSTNNEQDDAGIANAPSHNPRISQTPSLDGPSSGSAAAPNRVDFTTETPHANGPNEIESGDAPAASGNLNSSATTSSTAEGRGGEEAADEPTEAHEDEVAQSESEARSAAPHSRSNHDTPSGHGSQKQDTPSQSSQGAQATSSGRSALTYDSFWSTHSSSVVTYGYGPYAHPTSRPAGQAQPVTIPAKRPAPTDADTAMLESR